MARFLVWSDLHDEIWGGFRLPKLSKPVDGILIAGDTHTLGRHLRIPMAAARKYQCPVVLIWGNHEPYGSIWSNLLEDERSQLASAKAEGLEIRVLHGGMTEIAGVRIIGTTLWTDLKLYPQLETLARVEVSARMQDYQQISTAKNACFTIDDMLKLHQREKAVLFDALAQPFNGSRIVMPHHLPVRELIAPWRVVTEDPGNLMINGFASDLWQEIRAFEIDTWICGHSHDNNQWIGQGDHGPIRFVMNPRGYPGEKTDFNPAFVVAVS